MEAALGKEAIVEPPPSKKDLQEDSFKQKVEAWIAFCDRNKADGKEANMKAVDEKVFSDCLSALRDEKSEEPLTAAMLAAATPEEWRRMLGERLFPMIIRHPWVQMITVDLMSRITLMLLEFDNAEILQMLEDHDTLMGRVGEAVAVLRPHLVYGGVSRVSASCQTAFEEALELQGQVEAHSVSQSSG